MYKLIYYSNDKIFNIAIDYIYTHYEEHIRNFVICACLAFIQDMIIVGSSLDHTIKNIIPHDCDFTIEVEFNGHNTMYK